jgi:choline dehydrogenase-like flavoprotein
MLTRAGFTDIKTHSSDQNPGVDIHEMGGIRMGKDPKTSLLNKWNQIHFCKDVFVTDGACVTSFNVYSESFADLYGANRAGS